MRHLDGVKTPSVCWQAGLRPTAAAFFKFWLIILLESTAAGALGLAISASVKSVDAASAIAPASEADMMDAGAVRLHLLQSLQALMLPVLAPRCSAGDSPACTVLSCAGLWLQSSSSSSCLADSTRQPLRSPTGLVGSGATHVSTVARLSSCMVECTP